MQGEAALRPRDTARGRTGTQQFSPTRRVFPGRGQPVCSGRG